MTDPKINDRLATLAEKTRLLRSRARQLSSDHDEDDTLWMSSLDIIDELLSTVEGLIHDAGTEDRLHAGSVTMLCPNCHTCFQLTFDAMGSAAATCPVCGDTILLTNPT
jgi:ribosomal protein S27E